MNYQRDFLRFNRRANLLAAQQEREEQQRKRELTAWMKGARAGAIAAFGGMIIACLVEWFTR